MWRNGAILDETRQRPCLRYGDVLLERRRDKGEIIAIAATVLSHQVILVNRIPSRPGTSVRGRQECNSTKL